ncbi:hypothetical protein MGG_11156 [Pyricularia oryzae 70-15]|uniref:Uncharacterized protein n=1 Tax=Pyricularia oryzae (strain 70-15 / ATCC MYA-4617 / FGSC 8958) TaxID=242507 RepID=G4MVA5_PYRO7|nr:uncharacterized protein MGG_11156 [Pyricularia oryzae 70-15]EHA54927.1 hypothetical protein MGG_11156 [Pyricularia oryzae 70-15]
MNIRICITCGFKITQYLRKYKCMYWSLFRTWVMVVGAFPPLAPRSKQQQTDTANSRITEIESPSQGQPWAPMANAAAHEADRSFRSSQARGDRPPGDFRVPDYSDDRRHGLSSSRPYRVDWGEMDGPIFDLMVPRPLRVITKGASVAQVPGTLCLVGINPRGVSDGISPMTT